MFDDLLKEGTVRIKTVVGGVVAAVILAIVAWLSGVGITLPDDAIIVSTPTPIVEPTATEEPDETIPPKKESSD